MENSNPIYVSLAISEKKFGFGKLSCIRIRILMNYLKSGKQKTSILILDPIFHVKSRWSISKGKFEIKVRKSRLNKKPDEILQIRNPENPFRSFVQYHHTEIATLEITRVSFVE